MSGKSLTNIINKLITSDYTLERQFDEISAASAAGAERGARTRRKTQLFKDSRFVGNTRENPRDAPAPLALSDSEHEALDEEHAGENGTDDVFTPSALPAAGNEASKEVEAETEPEAKKPPAASGARGRRSAVRGGTGGKAAGKAAQTPECPACFMPEERVVLDYNKYEIISKLYQTPQVVVVRAICTEGKHAGKKAVLKAQPRAKGTIYQVTTETQMLTRIQRNAPRLCVQTQLGYGPISLEGDDGKKKDWYVLASLDAGDNLLERADGKNKHAQISFILKVGYEILIILEVLHNTVGVVHRDLKQGNITFDESTGMLCLIDFGTAKELHDRHGTRKTEKQDEEGTLQYMSIYVHEEYPLGERDDVWSLLFVMLEMATGLLPWHNDSKQTILSKKLRYVHTHFAKPGQPPPEGMPSELHACFCALFAHVQTLKKFDDAPDYARMRGILETAWNAAKLKPAISCAKF